MGLRLLGLSAMQHGRERSPLRLVGARVDHRLHRAVPFVNSSRPGIQQGIAKPVELGIPEMPTVDAADFKAGAMTLVGPALELARTEIVAIAVAERGGLDAPIDHQLLPCSKAPR